MEQIKDKIYIKILKSIKEDLDKVARKNRKSPEYACIKRAGLPSAIYTEIGYKSQVQFYINTLYPDRRLTRRRQIDNADFRLPHGT
jgi:hypothetical protein